MNTVQNYTNLLSNRMLHQYAEAGLLSQTKVTKPFHKYSFIAEQYLPKLKH